jgi:hypothetical protein
MTIRARTSPSAIPGTSARRYSRKPGHPADRCAAERVVARVLLDTGPLVALFKRNDAWHRRAAGWFSRNRADLVTTHAVLTEAWHLISPPARGKLMAFAAVALIVPSWRTTPSEADATACHLCGYADGLCGCDAGLLHDLGELRVATIDLGDFGVYRTEGRKALRVVF